MQRHGRGPLRRLLKARPGAWSDQAPPFAENDHASGEQSPAMVPPTNRAPSQYSARTGLPRQTAPVQRHVGINALKFPVGTAAGSGILPSHRW
jgi:hypothetical protein